MVLNNEDFPELRNTFIKMPLNGHFGIPAVLISTFLSLVILLSGHPTSVSLLLPLDVRRLYAKDA